MESKKLETTEKTFDLRHFRKTAIATLNSQGKPVVVHTPHITRVRVDYYNYSRDEGFLVQVYQRPDEEDPVLVHHTQAREFLWALYGDLGDVDRVMTLAKFAWEEARRKDLQEED